MYKPSLLTVFLFYFCHVVFGQVDSTNAKAVKLSPTGAYVYNSKDRTSGGTNLKLKIKRNNFFKISSDSHIGGIYTSYGKWRVHNDTLILECQFRKYKFSESGKKEPHIQVERYLIQGNKLCRTKGSNSDTAEICFIKR